MPTKYIIILLLFVLYSKADTPSSYYAPMISIDLAFGTGYYATYGHPSIACNCSNNGGNPFPCLWVNGSNGYACGGTVPNATIISLYQLYNNTQNTTILPTEIGSLTSLMALQLLNLNTPGPFPVQYLQLTNLINLAIANCHLNGSLPDLSALNLQSLAMPQNDFTGPVPASYSTMTNLTVLSLYDNQLTGNLSWLAPLQNLQNLFLDNNQFSGTLPTQLATMPLSYVSIQNNFLSGSIPFNVSALTSGSCLIGNNFFTGCGNVSVCTGSCLTCPLPRPNGAYCIGGSWVIPGSVTNNGSLSIISPIEIEGDLTITSTSVINIPNINTGTTYIVVNGTADISGNLNLTLNPFIGIGDTINVINATLVRGNFTAVIINAPILDPCLGNVQQNDGTSLSVLLVDTCSSDLATGGLSKSAFIGIVTGSIIAGILLLVLIGFLGMRYASPACKERIPIIGRIAEPESIR
jgi:hypothetical protein